MTAERREGVSPDLAGGTASRATVAPLSMDLTVDPTAEASPPASASPADTTAPAAFGRYQVRHALGAGGFGAVYLGCDSQLGRSVAIKVLHAGSAVSRAEGERFLQEARRLAQLRHPGIVSVHDVGVQDGQRYIVSDYLDGPSLGQWMKDNRPAWPEAARIVAAVADALAHAHARLIVHRDVKPANIIITADRAPVLVDFGLALDEVRAGGDREGHRLRHPVVHVAGASRRARPTASTAAPTSTAWAWCSTRCSPAACRFGRPHSGSCCARCATTSRSLRGSSSTTSRRSWRGPASKALAKRQQDRYTTAADFAEDLPQHSSDRRPPRRSPVRHQRRVAADRPQRRRANSDQAH